MTQIQTTGIRRKAAWVAIAVACVASFEGLRTTAYIDPVGIPTACFGETAGIKLGQRFTVAQCHVMLAKSLEQANRAVERCIARPMPPQRHAAFVSFTYNVGGSAFCSSTLVRRYNAGDVLGACNELLRWDKAKGVRLPGLTARRAEERRMCLEGL